MPRSISTLHRYNRPRVVAYVALMSYIILFAAGLTVFNAAHTTGGTLPPTAEPHPALQDWHPAELVKKAASDEPPDQSYTVHLSYANTMTFSDHLADIAPSRGWYTHIPGPSAITVTLPYKDTHNLHELARSPASWIMRHRSGHLNPQHPSTTNLVNAIIQIEASYQTKRNKILVIAGIILCSLSIAPLAAGAICAVPSRP